MYKSPPTPLSQGVGSCTAGDPSDVAAIAYTLLIQGTLLHPISSLSVPRTF